MPKSTREGIIPTTINTKSMVVSCEVQVSVLLPVNEAITGEIQANAATAAAISLNDALALQIDAGDVNLVRTIYGKESDVFTMVDGLSTLIGRAKTRILLFEATFDF